LKVTLVKSSAKCRLSNYLKNKKTISSTFWAKAICSLTSWQRAFAQTSNKLFSYFSGIWTSYIFSRRYLHEHPPRKTFLKSHFQTHSRIFSLVRLNPETMRFQFYTFSFSRLLPDRYTLYVCCRSTSCLFGGLASEARGVSNLFALYLSGDGGNW
jgi:hypothetical protein